MRCRPILISGQQEYSTMEILFVFYLGFLVKAIISALSAKVLNYDATTDEDNDEGSKLGANFYLNEFEARSHYAMFKVGDDDDSGGPGYYM
ncbi:hypothetical protein HDN1F_35180 [gamma proteobacterium HdN1]|nr:Hypothetical protein HDN1F_18000 [gamma proteobacterium HdN1]CBL47101.1 hypothetical protein HDN1F_35180 [gamma proteobacterium HdN1]